MTELEQLTRQFDNEDPPATFGKAMTSLASDREALAMSMSQFERLLSEALESGRREY